MDITTERISCQTHTRPFAVMAVLVTLLLQGCSLFGDSGDKTRIHITGQVRNAQDQTAIENASVEFGKGGFFEEGTIARQTTTDQQGIYIIDYTEDGYCGSSLFYIRASAEGFYQRINNSDIQCTEKLQTIDLELEPFPA